MLRADGVDSNISGVSVSVGSLGLVFGTTWLVVQYLVSGVDYWSKARSPSSGFRWWFLCLTQRAG